jgi:hypothetical protein
VAAAAFVLCCSIDNVHQRLAIQKKKESRPHVGQFPRTIWIFHCSITTRPFVSTSTRGRAKVKATAFCYTTGLLLFFVAAVWWSILATAFVSCRRCDQWSCCYFHCCFPVVARASVVDTAECVKRGFVLVSLTSSSSSSLSASWCLFRVLLLGAKVAGAVAADSSACDAMKIMPLALFFGRTQSPVVVLWFGNTLPPFPSSATLLRIFILIE